MPVTQSIMWCDQYSRVSHLYPPSVYFLLSYSDRICIFFTNSCWYMDKFWKLNQVLICFVFQSWVNCTTQKTSFRRYCSNTKLKIADKFWLFLPFQTFFRLWLRVNALPKWVEITHRERLPSQPISHKDRIMKHNSNMKIKNMNLI